MSVRRQVYRRCATFFRSMAGEVGVRIPDSSQAGWITAQWIAELMI